MLLGMEPLWHHAVSLGLVETMHSKLNKKMSQRSAIGDKFVPIHVQVDARIAVQLNQRQLWFLGQLQQGDKMVAASIVENWHVHSKTAGRDVKGLLEAKLVVAMRIGRMKRYELL